VGGGGRRQQRSENRLVIDYVDFGLFPAQCEEDLAGVIREHMTIVYHQIILPCVCVCVRVCVCLCVCMYVCMYVTIVDHQVIL
jgi:hypothetical protein